MHTFTSVSTSTITATAYVGETAYTAFVGLNSDFGTNGEVTTTFNSEDDAEDATAISPDSSDLLVAGTNTSDSDQASFALARYNETGALDTTFGSGTGEVVTDTYGYTPAATALVLNDGNIIVTGGDYDTGLNVAEYESDGSPYATFGGDGYVSDTNMYGGGYAYSVAHHSGKIFVGATAQDTYGGNYLSVMALNSDGSLDEAFGDGGFSLMPTSSGPSGSMIAVDPNSDNIYLASEVDGSLSFAAFNSAGYPLSDAAQNIDTGYPVDQVDAIDVESDGTILIAASGGHTLGLVHLNSNGSFASGDNTSSNFDGGDADVSAACFASDGTILAAGSISGGVAVERFNSDGTADSSFGYGGLATVPLSEAFTPTGVTLDTAGDVDLTGGSGSFDVAQLVGSQSLSVDVAGLPEFSYSMPSSDPSLESGMDSFSPPVSDSSGTPAIAASDLSANADDALVLTGNLSSDQFVAFGQGDSDTGTLTNPTIQTSDSDGVTVTLGSAPSTSMYLIWPYASSGVSAPVAVNQTDATWIGTDDVSFPQTEDVPPVVTAAVGDTVSIYGRNLSNGASTPQSWVYLQPSSGTGEWAYVNSVNNYQVNFAVASDLSNGQYQVWINNGLGGDYGWSQEPTPLTVASAVSWPDEYIFNVKYPSLWPNGGNGVQAAAGNGSTDDAPTIYAALQAISTLHASYPNALATLKFPAGTFLLDDSTDANGDDEMTLGSNTLVVGEGTGLGGTEMKFDYSDYASLGYHYAMGFADPSTPGSVYNIEIDSMSLVFGVDQPTGADLIREHNATNLTLNNVILDTSNTGSNNPLQLAVDWQGSSFLTLEGSTVISGEVSFIGSNDATVINTTFFLGNNLVDPIYIDSYGGGGYDVSVSGCTVEEVNSGTTDLSGWGQGNFVEDTAYYGNVYNEYVGGNAADDMGAPAAVNEGDFVNVEGAAYAYYGTGILESDDTLWVPCDTPLTGFAVTITGGTGVGQMRVVTSSTSESEDDESGRLLTLNAPWTVSPDDTSTFMVDTMMYNSAFYDNSVSFDATYGQNLSGAAGIEFWMGGYNDVADDNTVEYGKYGVLLASVGGFARYASDEPDSTQFPPLYFVQALNNQISDSSIAGIAYEQLNDPTEEDFIGTIVSGNTITGVTEGYSDDPAQGISLGDGVTPDGRSGKAELSVIEQNSVSGCTGSNAYDIGVYDNAPSVLVYDNTFVNDPTPNAVQWPVNSGGTAYFVGNIT